MINRHSRLTRSIGQIGPIQSTTSLRLNLHQAQRNLSATTATAATSTEGVNETKNQKTSSYAEIKGNFCLYQSIDPESIQRIDRIPKTRCRTTPEQAQRCSKFIKFDWIGRRNRTIRNP
ncbi:hypothetical protein MJO28_015313 [Puccinia striiformis f. sp. tritici]|uniref:Uncharacterized protein n=1 Tax=Puccinia striiformis f. sp. tritici TaxID=168172 RepID=A0ACC0DTZ4_9BASI|nr:hypothetical protein MJO28_015313 [Puccinia striiformis f. sp. tritici]